LVNIYGTLEVPPYKGIGRKPLPRLIPPEDLKYVKIEKKKMGEKVVETLKNIVFGNKKDILKMLEIEENGYIDTSYVSTSPTGSENHLSPSRFQTFNRNVF